MKAFYSILLLVFLTSCTGWTIDDISNIPDSTTPVVNTVVEQTEEEMNEAIAELPEEVKEFAWESTLDKRIMNNDGESWETQTSEEDASSEEEDTVEIAPVVEETETEAVETSFAPKVVVLSTSYNNPKMEVIMNIEYSLDENETISDISVTSPNYGGMPEFNNGVQSALKNG